MSRRRCRISPYAAALPPEAEDDEAGSGHKIFPYLLRDRVIDQPNRVWAADITYIPLDRGFLCLVATLDWASRAVLAWRLSNTMNTALCVVALDEALARFGRPAIFNTDQGSQLTATPSLAGWRAPSRISMDARGRWIDNVFIERLLRRRPRGPGRNRHVDRFLQRPQAASGPGRPNPDGGVVQGDHRAPHRQRS